MTSTTGLPRAHQTMILAHRAMVRDLGLVAEAAAARDATREPALRAYTERLVQLVEHHHEGEDAVLWPRLREQGAPADALATMTAEHADVLARLTEVHRLAADGDLGELSIAADALREVLAGHCADEERELTGRLAPALDARTWSAFERSMLRTAPKWTLLFMPPWLASVATPAESGGVPAPPLAKLLRGRLARKRRAALGELA